MPVFASFSNKSFGGKPHPFNSIEDVHESLDFYKLVDLKYAREEKWEQLLYNLENPVYAILEDKTKVYRNTQNNQILMLACKGLAFQYCDCLKKIIIKLIKNGANVNCDDRASYPILHILVDQNNKMPYSVDAIRFLIEKCGANPSQLDIITPARPIDLILKTRENCQTERDAKIVHLLSFYTPNKSFSYRRGCSRYYIGEGRFQEDYEKYHRVPLIKAVRIIHEIYENDLYYTFDSHRQEYSLSSIQQHLPDLCDSDLKFLSKWLEKDRQQLVHRESVYRFVDDMMDAALGQVRLQQHIFQLEVYLNKRILNKYLMTEILKTEFPSISEFDIISLI